MTQNNNGNEKFSYSYVAPTERERKEVESIRRQYDIEGNCLSKMERLQALDKKVKNLPQIVALSFGVIGIMLFGGGMSMILEGGWLLWGTLVALVGIVPVMLAYPAYKQLLKKRKDKYRAEILRLSDEILNENSGRE